MSPHREYSTHSFIRTSVGGRVVAVIFVVDREIGKAGEFDLTVHVQLPLISPLKVSRGGRGGMGWMIFLGS